MCYCWVCCVECCDVRAAQPQFFGLCAAGRDGFHTQARARLHGKSPLGASTHIIVRGCEDFAALRFIDKRAKRLCLRKHVDTLKGSNHFGSALKYAFTPSFQEFLD